MKEMGDTGQYVYRTPYASTTTGHTASGEPRDPLRSSSPLKRQFEQSQLSVIVAVLGALAVLYMSTNDTKQLAAQIDGLQVKSSSLGAEIGSVKTSADGGFKAAAQARTTAENAQKAALKTFQGNVADNFKSVSQSIDATNVEVELVKNSVANLGARVDRDFANVGQQINGVAINLAATNSRVAQVDARASGIEGNMERIGAGLESFYNDVKKTTEWSVTGPGGCNDKFSGNLGAKSNWKVTRGFAHSREKVPSLEACKVICKKAEWGCKNIAFYGAGPGWCYGFATCQNHSTGQGWGGYTTYSLSGLKEFKQFAGDL